MAETDTEMTGPATLAQGMLVKEIERTRASLAETIDEIADRVSPANVARRTTDRVRERLSQVDPKVGGTVAVAAVAVVGLLIWRRLRK